MPVFFLPKKYEKLSFSIELIAKYLVVSEVCFTDAEEVQVKLSDKEKCPRCWLRRELTEMQLCERCSEKAGVVGVY